MSASNLGDSVKAILYAFLANLGLAIAKTGAAMVRKKDRLPHLVISLYVREVSALTGNVVVREAECPHLGAD